MMRVAVWNVSPIVYSGNCRKTNPHANHGYWQPRRTPHCKRSVVCGSRTTHELHGRSLITKKICTQDLFIVSRAKHAGKVLPFVLCSCESNATDYRVHIHMFGCAQYKTRYDTQKMFLLSVGWDFKPRQRGQGNVLDYTSTPRRRDMHGR